MTSPWLIALLSLAVIGWMVVIRGRVLRKTASVQERLEHDASLERRYRDLVDNAMDIVYSHDLDGRITSFNPAGERITGYATAEAVQINISKLVAPDQLALAREMTARKVQGDPVTIYELDLIHKLGRRITVEISSRPILREGKVTEIQGFARDVTERKRAQRILKESEERKKAILESALDCILTIDAGGRVIEFNPAAEKAFGFSRDQALGKPISELLLFPSSDLAPRPGSNSHFDVARASSPASSRGVTPRSASHGETPCELAAETAALQRPHENCSRSGAFHALPTGEALPLDMRIELAARRSDRSEFPVELAVTRIGSTEPADFTVFLRDISERKRAEARTVAFSNLAQSLSLATTAEEAAWVVVETADKLLGWDACYVHLLTPNLKSTVPVLNYDVVQGKRANVPWRRADKLIAPMDRKVIEEGAQLILRQDPGQSVPELVPFGDERRLSSSLMFVPIRHRMKVVGILSIQSYRANVYDTEALQILQSLADLCAGSMDRIQAASALRESEERFSKAFRSSPVPISITTLEEGRYIDVNDSFLSLLGFAREEVIGQTSLHLGIWFDPQDRDRLVHQIRSEKSMRAQEVKLLAKDRSERTVLASFEPIHLASESCLIAILYDLTERLNLESQLRQAQKMEAVGQLAAGIAHDFNNIMTIIQGHASLVLATDYLRPEAVESLEEVSKAADRAANLTRQLLTFSRRQMMQPRPLNLNEVVGQVVKMLHAGLRENISIECALEPGLPSFPADVGMMEQLIMNLGVNARDAMPQGGRLLIRTQSIVIEPTDLVRRAEARTGRFVHLTVSDTGSGMDAGTLARIFEPFFTTKDVGQGTGLGLATAYGIVKQHDGWIEVKSEKDKGSTFDVFLPLIEKDLGPSPGIAKLARR